MKRARLVAASTAATLLGAGALVISCSYPAGAACSDQAVRRAFSGDSAMGLVSRCIDGYVQVDYCKYTQRWDPCGDSMFLARYVDGRWRLYASFPNSTCYSQAVRDHVPVQFRGTSPSAGLFPGRC